MNTHNLFMPRIAAALLTGFPAFCGAWTPGIYPVSPARMTSSGFAVANQNRNDVIAFWHAVYQASEGYEERVGWTGNYSGTPGKTSAAFVSDVERRLNYFRAMCGVPADAQVNTGSKVLISPGDQNSNKPASSTPKSVAAQQAALMLVRNFNPVSGANPAMTHNPSNSLVGWSPAAWNASSKGNISFGFYGPGAVTEYMLESPVIGAITSSWNLDVGHRRLCIFPPATDYATGDQPGKSAQQPPSNVLYVLQKPGEYSKGLTDKFVSYPSAGFFPAAINAEFWSLSRHNADFSAATVTMKTLGGTPVSVTNIKRGTGFGDPAIVWQVGAAAAKRYVDHDTTFTVRVSGISGVGVPGFYEYQVTLINPDQLTSDQAITGTSRPPANTSTSYSFHPPKGAESLLVASYKRSSMAWSENAETENKARILDDTSGNYDLMAAMDDFTGFDGVSGRKSFHLTFPTSYDLIALGVPEQSFELDRNIIPKEKAKLNFLFRRGFMTKASNLAVEISSDDGLTWNALATPITGVSESTFDNEVSKVSLSLPKSSNPVRIRFRYYTTGGLVYIQDASLATGIFIDDIRTTNCDWLDRKKQNRVPASKHKFVFNTSSAGAKLVKNEKWMLRLETKLGGKWFNGPMKPLTIGSSTSRNKASPP